VQDSIACANNSPAGCLGNPSLPSLYVHLLLAQGFCQDIHVVYPCCQKHNLGIRLLTNSARPLPMCVLCSYPPAGFFASACSLPFDFVKTRLQKMTPNPDGTMPYKGPVDCAMQTLKQEGPLKFYTGFPTYLVR
jgi:hypothetical protein